METIVLFGCGEKAKSFIKRIKLEEYIFSNQRFIFTDNNNNLAGHKIGNYDIISPNEIPNTNYDKIVITSSLYELEIRKQLHLMNIPQNKILSLQEYICNLFPPKIYDKRYKDVEISNEKWIIDNIVIYTAIMGDYDDLKEPFFNDDKITYVCFTDNKNIKSDIWNIEYINSDKDNSRFQARKLKMEPHILFPEYDTSIWIDGKFQIKNDLREYIKKYGKTSSMLCFPHYERDCIYMEAAACANGYVDNQEKIFNQISAYIQNGYPYKNGLYETGCIVRKHNNAQIIKLMQVWEEQICKYSLRDQLSLPFSCWKEHYQPDICDLNINDNEWIKLCGHKL